MTGAADSVAADRPEENEDSLNDQDRDELLRRVLEIEKTYAHELKGVREQRRKDIRELVNKLIAERLEK